MGVIELKSIEWIETENGCFECTSHSLVGIGYPHLRRNGKNIRISRFVYEECFGEIPDGLVVRHKCDNKLCINPEHLELGTMADNARDRAERGQSAKGSRNAASKLNEQDIPKIRELLSKGFTCKKIAALYGVDRTCIGLIKRGKAWKHA